MTKTIITYILLAFGIIGALAFFGLIIKTKTWALLPFWAALVILALPYSWQLFKRTRKEDSDD